MKKLNQFLEFNTKKFFEGKAFIATGSMPWKDFDTGRVRGTKIEVVIAKDDTHYDLREGETVSNLYEKLTFKVPKAIEIPVNAQVEPKGVKATVYGEYRNQLACTAEDVLVVSQG